MNILTHSPPESLRVSQPDGRARAIAERALRLASSHPHAPALDVLDLAIQGHEGGEFPDFDGPGMPAAFSALLPSPFASLLRSAFMPAWSDADFTTAAPAAGAGAQMWSAYVLAEFADRYGFNCSAAPWRRAF